MRNPTPAPIRPAALALLGGPGVVRYSEGAHSDESTPWGQSFRLKYVAVENLGRFLDESAGRLMHLIEANERTAQRRREQGMLSHEESDRIARIARVVRRAMDALGDEARGKAWLKRPNRALRGFAPLGLLATDAGAELVTDELGRIEYGDLY